MDKQIILLLQSDEDIFTAKHIFFRADTTLDILTYSALSDYRASHEARDDQPLFYLIDDINIATPLSQILKETQKKAPIFLLDNDCDSDQLVSAYQNGLAGYIPKPLKLELNLRRLQNYFDLMQIPLQVWPYCHIPSFGEETEGTFDANFWWELH